jgi:hypothetical protein
MATTVAAILILSQMAKINPHQQVKNTGQVALCESAANCETLCVAGRHLHVTRTKKITCI